MLATESNPQCNKVDAFEDLMRKRNLKLQICPPSKVPVCPFSILETLSLSLKGSMR